MTFVLSFLRYAITHLLSSSSNWIGEFVHAVPLHWPHASEKVNIVGHVYGRCILRWHNLTNSCTRIICRPSPSIHSPPMTCLRFRLSIASLAGTLLGYDARLLLTSEEDSEAAFENHWSPVSHSSVGSACSLVFLQVFFRRGIPAIFSWYHDIIDCGRGDQNLCLLS